MLPSASDNKTDIAMQRRSFEKYMALANEGPATGVQVCIATALLNKGRLTKGREKSESKGD